MDPAKAKMSIKNYSCCQKRQVLNPDVAWRIDEFLVRGEIDNRVRGRVTGRLWFAGREDPVEIDLVGNGWRDVAGWRQESRAGEPVRDVQLPRASHIP